MKKREKVLPLPEPGGPNKGLALEQAKTGYKNAQELIRFVDSKATYLTGGTTLSLGFVLQAVKQFTQLPDGVSQSLDAHPYLMLILKVVAVLSLLVGALCLWSCILSLVGRPPLRKVAAQQTILFPYYQGNDEEEKYCSKIRAGMTEAEVAAEFEAQVWNVGIILRRKLFRHRCAGFLFLAQLVLLAVGGMIFVFFVI